jgi:hypothetical protein
MRKAVLPRQVQNRVNWPRNRVDECESRIKNVGDEEVRSRIELQRPPRAGPRDRDNVRTLIEQSAHDVAAQISASTCHHSGRHAGLAPS